MLNYSNNVELPLKSKGKNPMGKSALRQVVSMVIQLERTDDVATAGGISNDNPPEQPIALYRAQQGLDDCCTSWENRYRQGNNPQNNTVVFFECFSGEFLNYSWHRAIYV
jgi:hypothetical protein